MHQHLWNDSSSFHPVHPLIRAFGPRVLHHAKGHCQDEEVQEFTDRAYWEVRGSKATVAMADEVLKLVAEFAPGLELKYNKFYIGLATNGIPNNFLIFRPQKSALRLEVRLPPSPETEAMLETAGLDVMDYDKRWGRYRLRLNKGEVVKFTEVLSALSQQAFAVAGKGVS